MIKKNVGIFEKLSDSDIEEESRVKGSQENYFLWESNVFPNRFKLSVVCALQVVSH